MEDVYKQFSEYAKSKYSTDFSVHQKKAIKQHVLRHYAQLYGQTTVATGFLSSFSRSRALSYLLLFFVCSVGVYASVAPTSFEETTAGVATTLKTAVRAGLHNISSPAFVEEAPADEESQLVGEVSGDVQLLIAHDERSSAGTGEAANYQENLPLLEVAVHDETTGRQNGSMVSEEAKANIMVTLPSPAAAVASAALTGDSQTDLGLSAEVTKEHPATPPIYPQVNTPSPGLGKVISSTHTETVDAVIPTDDIGADKKLPPVLLQEDDVLPPADILPVAVDAILGASTQ